MVECRFFGSITFCVGIVGGGRFVIVGLNMLLYGFKILNPYISGRAFLWSYCDAIKKRFTPLYFGRMGVLPVSAQCFDAAEDQIGMEGIGDAQPQEAARYHFSKTASNGNPRGLATEFFGDD